MMKICPKCRGTWAGGDFCLECGVKQPLLDMADPRAEEYLAGDEMRLAVMSHYAERRGMVRTCFGFLIGAGLAAFTLRGAFGSTGSTRVFWIVAAVVVFLAVMRLVVGHALRLAKAGNDGKLAYTCPEEQKPIRLLGKQDWTTW